MNDKFNDTQPKEGEQLQLPLDLQACFYQVYGEDDELNGFSKNAIIKNQGTQQYLYNRLNLQIQPQDDETKKIIGDKLSLSINTSKLWELIKIQFTEKNQNKRSKLNQEIKLPIEYIAKIQDKPLKTKIDHINMRKYITYQLALLKSCNFIIADDDGKSKSYSFIGDFEVSLGFVHTELATNLAKELKRQPIIMKNIKAQKIDARNPVPWAIHSILCEHFFMTNNVKTGTNDRMKVASILKRCYQLPSIKQVRASGNSWQHRIKEPFEKALEYLVDNGCISEHRYQGKKNRILTDDELAPKKYEEWIEQILIFKCVDNQGHIEYLKSKPIKKHKPVKKKVAKQMKNANK